MEIRELTELLERRRRIYKDYTDEILLKIVLKLKEIEDKINNLSNNG